MVPNECVGVFAAKGDLDAIALFFGADVHDGGPIGLRKGDGLAVADYEIGLGVPDRRPIGGGLELPSGFSPHIGVIDDGYGFESDFDFGDGQGSGG